MVLSDRSIFGLNGWIVLALMLGLAWIVPGCGSNAGDPAPATVEARDIEPEDREETESPSPQSLQELAAAFAAAWNASDLDAALGFVSPVKTQKDLDYIRKRIGENGWDETLPQLGEARYEDRSFKRPLIVYPLEESPGRTLSIRVQDEGDMWTVISFKFPDKQKGFGGFGSNGAASATRIDLEVDRTSFDDWVRSIESETAGPEKSLVANWDVGSRFQMKMTKEKDGQRAAQASTTVDVEVKEKNADGYLLSWKYGETEMGGGAAAQNPMVADLLELTAGMTLLIRTDESGYPRKLENVDEVAAKVKGAVDKIKTMIAAVPLPDEQKKKILSTIERMMEPAVIEQGSLEEPQLLLATCARPLPLKGLLRVESELPNPITRTPIKSETCYSLRSAEDGGEAVLEWRGQPDAEAAQKMVQDFMKDFGADVDMEAVASNLKFEIEDFGRIVWDVERGWPKKVVFERSIDMGMGSQGERRVFEMQ